MQLAPLIVGVLLNVANSFLPLTSPTHANSIPNLTFRPYHHIKPAVAAQAGYSPAQIRHAYGVDQLTGTGSGRSIAIVDAYKDSHLAADLQNFISAYHLQEMNGLPGQPSCSVKMGPHPCFEADAEGTTANADWSTETALDTEWAHAIAGKADILVVEAKTASASSFATALTATMAAKPSVVSLSWGGSEFAKEADWDETFHQSMVVAASGDSGYGASFPATSPNVLAVGGTTLQLTSTGAKVGTETAWSGSGGGESTYENRPIWQAKNLLGSILSLRLTPDVSYNADPATGYNVYDNGQWLEVGGTSAAAPQWAAMLTLGARVPDNASIYKLGTAATRSTYFSDISSGTNGTCKILCQTRPGYDAVTGLGSPIAKNLIGAL